jgi:outer membrane protein assembly factor BamB
MGVYVVGAGGYAFVDLYSFDGALIWTRFIEAGGVDTESVSVDSAAVYVAGTIEISQPWPKYDTGHTFVAKFDLSGNELWSQRIDVDSRLATAISVGPKGVYVSENSHSFVQCHDCPHFTDTFFTAIDFNGNTLWTRQLNNETLDVECSCSSTLSVGPTGIYVGENTVLRAPLGQFAFVSFVRKYDFGGNVIWTRFVSLDSSLSRVLGISANSKGAYVAGDGIVQHLDPNGNEVWTMHIGGQVFRTVSLSSRGVFVAGFPSIDRLCTSPTCIHN